MPQGCSGGGGGGEYTNAWPLGSDTISNVPWGSMETLGNAQLGGMSTAAIDWCIITFSWEAKYLLFALDI